MNRVFIQVKCKYPHGEALANYIQCLAKAILCAGYEVILATDINEEYDFSTITRMSRPITIIPVVADKEKEKNRIQKMTGFCEERLGILKEYNITNNDWVMVFWLQNAYFLENLFQMGKQIGFRTVCGVLELLDVEDYPTLERYQEVSHAEGSIYLKADAILSISEYIDKYYENKGMKTWRFPPMIDSKEHVFEAKKTEKYKFIIPSSKDSLTSMLMAFACLSEEELNRMELHLCGMRGEVLKEILTEETYERLAKVMIVHDWMKYEELLALYRRMHFMLIARDSCQRTLANFPSKVPEGMINGIVPLVSRVGDYTKYYLENEYDSLFIEDDSVSEISRIIRKAIYLDQKEYLRYSMNARKTAKERFDYRVWVHQIGEMLRNA